MQPKITEEKMYDVLEAMETYGGSFVVQLAGLYRLGDPRNKMKLYLAFSNYFLDYEKVVDKKM